MSERNLLILRADASESIGSGHVMRLIALAQGAARSDSSVLFVLGGEPGTCAEAVANAGFPHVLAQNALGSSADSEFLLRLSRERGAHATVVDGYTADRDYIATLSETTRCVVIDDLADRSLPAHIIVNPNYGADALSYTGAAHTRVLAGSDYALLRAEFVEHQPTTVRETTPLRLLLTFGGSDPVNAGARVVESLGRLGCSARIRVIVGGNYQGESALRRVIDGSGLDVDVVRNPPNMAKALSWGQLVITAAGGTLWELAFLERPVAAFSIVDNQDATAASLAERDMVFGGQRLGDLSDLELASVLEKFLVDADKRSAYARRFHTLIDGRGADRVIEAVIDG